MKPLLICLTVVAALVYSVWAGGHPIHVNEPEVITAFCRNATNLLVIKCEYDTCSACQRLAPGIVYLADKYPDITFLVGNMSSAWSVLRVPYNVTKTPTVACVVYNKMVEHIQSTNVSVVEAGVLRAKAIFDATPPPAPVVATTTECPDYYYWDVGPGSY